MLVPEANDIATPPLASIRAQQPSSPSVGSNTPKVKTLDERNEARASEATAVSGGGSVGVTSSQSNNNKNDRVTPSIDTNAPVLPSAVDLPPPRGGSVPSTSTTPTTPTSTNNKDDASISNVNDGEWIPEGPFPQRSDAEETEVTERRRDAIRDAFGHAWYNLLARHFISTLTDCLLSLFRMTYTGVGMRNMHLAMMNYVLSQMPQMIHGVNGVLH
jgi:hypothetical protein